MAMWLTSCWSWDEMWVGDETAWQQPWCNSLPVGHGMRYGVGTWQNKGQCDSLPIGHGMRRLRLRAMSLTYWQSWHEVWWDCIPEKEQCLSHTDSYGMEFGETTWQKKITVTHSLLAIWLVWWDYLEEERAVWLTFCCPWDEMRLHTRKGAMSLTYWQSWHEMWWDSMEEERASDLLSVGHVMRCDESVWQKKMAVWLTNCWSWDKMSWDCLPDKRQKGSVTHSLLVMG